MLRQATKYNRLNVLDLEGSWLWAFRFFLAAFYGSLLIFVVSTIVAWSYGVGFSATLELVGIVLVSASVLIFWPILVRIGRESPRSVLQKIIEDNQVTIFELLQTNDELESESCFRGERLTQLNLSFGIAIQKFKISAFQCDLDHRYVWSQNGTFSSDSIIGKIDDEFLPEAAAREIRLLKEKALLEDKVHEGELCISVDGEPRVYNVQVVAIRNGLGEIVGTTMISCDVTEQAAWREHLVLLLREVNHRACNMLSVVSSICSLSSRKAKTVEIFRDSLKGRIDSLACSLNLLTCDHWSGSDIRELIGRQLLCFPNDVQRRVHFAGPDITLLAKAVQTIGLIIHELGKESVARGSLSDPKGRVEIHWHCIGASHASQLELTWTEYGASSDGEAFAEEFREVFLRDIAGAELGGTTSITKNSQGVIFVLNASREFFVNKSTSEKSDHGVLIRPFASENRVREEFNRRLAESLRRSA